MKENKQDIAIKLLATDVDGVLTDGKVYVNEMGREIKTLCFKDFDARSILRSKGIKFALITGEKNNFTKYIEEKFIPDYIYTGCKDKMSAINQIAEKEKITLDEIAYIGDGKYDIPALKSVKYGYAPNDAISKAKEASTYILSTNGGNGCLSECVDLLCDWFE